MPEHASTSPSLDVEPGTLISPGSANLPLNTPDTIAPLLFTLSGRDERGGISLEFLRKGIDHSALAINGLRHWIAVKRLHHAEPRKDSINHSQQVLREAPEAFLEPRASDKDRKSINQDLAPIALIERRQKIRAGRRQSRAIVERSGRQYRLQRVWGDDIGTPEYAARVRAERRGFSNIIHKRRALGADKLFVESKTLAEKKTGRVSKSATSKDIPGRITNKLATRRQLNVGELRAHVTKLEVSRAHRQRDMADRYIERLHDQDKQRANKQRKQDAKSRAKASLDTAKKINTAHAKPLNRQPVERTIYDTVAQDMFTADTKPKDKRFVDVSGLL